jgi:NAD(P)-dependent dehydrogenase (short-subunit alcohol dehydrogenase family)
MSQKTAVITGGAKGLGLGILEALTDIGWRCAIIDFDPEGEEVVRKFNASFHRADVSDPEQLQRVFGEIAATAGKIDGLVNSAGLTRTGPSDTLPVTDWQRVIDVDLSGTFYVCQAAYPHLNDGASIVNIASIAAVRALPGRVAYTAAKFGVVGVTRVLAVEWAHRGIRVNAIGPTWAKTPFLDDLVAAGKLDIDELKAKMPMGRLASVEDVAKAALFLLGENSEFVTGQTLFVDGGYTWAG